MIDKQDINEGNVVIAIHDVKIMSDDEVIWCLKGDKGEILEVNEKEIVVKMDRLKDVPKLIKTGYPTAFYELFKFQEPLITKLEEMIEW